MASPEELPPSQDEQSLVSTGSEIGPPPTQSSLPLGPAYGPWRKTATAVQLTVLAAIVGGGLLLALSGSVRGRFVKAALVTYERLYPRELKTEIYQLPPPPPKMVPPKVVYQGRPTFAVKAADARPAPPVSAAPEPEEEAPAANEEPATSRPPEKTPAAQAAYDVFIAKSETARKLAANGVAGLQFKEWKPVRNDPPEFWIDMVTARGDGAEAHFIWSIDTESGTVRALSQDARDLERRKP